MMACGVSGFVAAAMKFMADIDAVEESQAGTMNAQLMLCANGAISYRGHEMTYGFSFAESCVASLFGIELPSEFQDTQPGDIQMDSNAGNNGDQCPECGSPKLNNVLGYDCLCAAQAAVASTKGTQASHHKLEAEQQQQQTEHEQPAQAMPHAQESASQAFDADKNPPELIPEGRPEATAAAEIANDSKEAPPAHAHQPTAEVNVEASSVASSSAISEVEKPPRISGVGIGARPYVNRDGCVVAPASPPEAVVDDYPAQQRADSSTIVDNPATASDQPAADPILIEDTQQMSQSDHKATVQEIQEITVQEILIEESPAKGYGERQGSERDMEDVGILSFFGGASACPEGDDNAHAVEEPSGVGIVLQNAELEAHAIEETVGLDPSGGDEVTLDPEAHAIEETVGLDPSGGDEVALDNELWVNSNDELTGDIELLEAMPRQFACVDDDIESEASFRTEIPLEGTMTSCVDIPAAVPGELRKATASGRVWTSVPQVP